MHDRSSRRKTLAMRVLVGLLAIGALAAAGLKVKDGFGPGKVEASSSPGPGEAKDKDKAKEKEPATVAVAAVEMGSISSYVAATANLVAEDEVKVVAEADGKVTRLLVEEGDTVAKGQTLVQIDTADASLAVDKADIAVRNAQINRERTEKMAAERLISAQDLDKVRYEHAAAAQALAEARHRLRKTSVSAPFGGRITVRRVQPGQAVKVGDELFILADFEPLVARIFLPEREVLDLRVGQPVRMALRAREETRFEGRIRQISPVVDTASGTVKVTIEAVQPPPSVRPGAFVTVDVVRETRAQAFIVPRTAVVRELHEAYVFVVDGKVARKRPVEVGLEEGVRLQITAGVKAGEQVVTSGHGALKDQAPVTVAAAKL
jgi:membrane fusion protein, multidrug efflux system